MWKAISGIIFLLSLSACNMAAATEVSVSPSENPVADITEFVLPTDSPSATLSPTASPTVTATATASDTPTVTSTPSITPTASITPVPEVLFRTDQLALVEVPAFLQDGIDAPLIVFANSNNQTTIRNLSTAEPQNTTQVLYITQAGSLNRTQLLELPATAGNSFYPAPNGNAIAYFIPTGAAPGLYIMNIVSTAGFSSSVRVWASTNLVQRGILSVPVWTSDGEQLAVTLQTGYALDIFLYARDGSNRTNLTQSPAYDFFPAFSPDGRYLAFVSDRATCPSWNPADGNACDALSDSAPYGGTVYLMDLASREVRQVSDVFVTEAPRWINSNLLVIAGGDQTDLLNPQRNLFLADVRSNEVQAVRLAGDDESVLYLGDAWSPDGSELLVQRATASETEILIMSANGTVIRRRGEELAFSRFGVALDWSPLGDRITIGGVGGRCPYGIRVAETNFDWVATGNQPTACEPSFSPDGRNLVFTGVTSAVDGRLDIYSATADGFGAVNLTVDLRGTNTLIGWVGNP